MSSRRLMRMKPEEIQRIINVRTGEITEGEEALKRLEARKERAALIATTFQYTQHKIAMDKETVAVPADVVLLKTLCSLGVRPLDRDSVMRYQNKMKRTIFNLLAKSFGFPLFFSGLIGVIIIGAGLFAAPGSLGGLVAVHTIWGLILGVGSFLLWAEHTIIPRREWNEQSIQHANLFSDRSNTIPDSVFEVAFPIHNALSSTQFVVHQLRKDYGPLAKFIPDFSDGFLRGDPDPFLEARFAGESYFIAVWDEPGFDGKLMEVE